MSGSEAASQFYTGLVADLYAVLRSSEPEVEPYARFIARTGEPALELGCGDGDPLLDLRSRGLDVHGLDASADMLDRCRRRAAASGLDVVLHHSTIESMALGLRYRSIFLAGPTFNLLPDDEIVTAALARIGEHLEADGAALIPLFVPDPAAFLPNGRSVEHRTADGTVLRCTTTSVERNESTRCQTAILRYERIGAPGVSASGAGASGDASGAEMVERPWVLHWHSVVEFRALVASAGLAVRAVIGVDGRPTADDSRQFAFIVGHP